MGIDDGHQVVQIPQPPQRGPLRSVRAPDRCPPIRPAGIQLQLN